MDASTSCYFNYRTRRCSITNYQRKGRDKRGGTISAVRLKNNSGKSVVGVKFAWYLFRDKTPEKILQKDETPVFFLTDFFKEKSKIVEYPIVSFGNIYKPLVKDGKLTGDFVIEVAVSEIIYEDGSNWIRK